LEGKLKANKMKLLQAWIEIHQDELMADWELASKGESIIFRKHTNRKFLLLFRRAHLVQNFGE